MTVPSVKGSMLLGSVVVVRRARDAGRIPEPRLAKLGERTREVLDEQIQLSHWYPMEIFAELLDLDWEVSGGRDPDYMRESGKRNAVAMQRASRYQQLDYLERAERPKNAAEVVSQVRLTSSITQSYFNFMQVEVGFDPDRPNVLQITYSDTHAFPEALRYSTEGFMTQLNQVRGSSRTWTSERRGDRIVFSLELREPSPGGGG